MTCATAVIGAPRASQSPLGPADVEDDELAAFVAAGLGVRHATVLTSSAKAFPYDRPAITTAGRYLVTGTARTGTGEVRAFALFVKVIHACQRSPLRSAIPAHLRTQAAALIPWQTEADLYRSDLRDRLPADQLWIFSFLTGAELASVQIGGSARLAPERANYTAREKRRPPRDPGARKCPAMHQRAHWRAAGLRVPQAVTGL